MSPRPSRHIGAALSLALGLIGLGTGSAYGAVSFPMLEVVSQEIGDGIVLSAGQLVLTLTAPYILSAPGVIGMDLTPDAPVELVANAVGNSQFDVVSLLVGAPGDPLLQGGGGTLTLTSLGFGTGTLSGGGIVLTGGSLAPPLPSEVSVAGAFSGASSDDFSQDFVAGTVQAKIGAVVPEPLSVGLVGTSIMGLLVVRRRRRV